MVLCHGALEYERNVRGHRAIEQPELSEPQGLRLHKLSELDWIGQLDQSRGNGLRFGLRCPGWANLPGARLWELIWLANRRFWTGAQFRLGVSAPDSSPKHGRASAARPKWR